MKEGLTHQLIVRSANRLNFSSTWANDFSVYIPEFLPTDCDKFKIKLIQVEVPKAAFPDDATSGNQLRANFIEINAFFAGGNGYGFDTLNQGLNRYTSFIDYGDSRNASNLKADANPTMIVNRFDQNILRVQVWGHFYNGVGTAVGSADDMTRSLLQYRDQTAGNKINLKTCNLVFEITPIYEN